MMFPEPVSVKAPALDVDAVYFSVQLTEPVAPEYAPVPPVTGPGTVTVVSLPIACAGSVTLKLSTRLKKNVNVPCVIPVVS